MTTTTDGQLNEVDLNAVGALVEAIKQDPSAAQTTWSAEVRWTGAFRSVAAVRGHAPIASDEPAGLGGTDRAPNPVEQLLGSLGNCLAVGYAANASVAGITIRDLRIDLDGDIDLHTFLGLADGHAGFSALRVAVHQLHSRQTPARGTTVGLVRHAKVQANTETRNAFVPPFRR